MNREGTGPSACGAGQSAAFNLLCEPGSLPCALEKWHSLAIWLNWALRQGQHVELCGVPPGFRVASFLDAAEASQGKLPPITDSQRKGEFGRVHVPQHIDRLDRDEAMVQQPERQSPKAHMKRLLSVAQERIVPPFVDDDELIGVLLIVKVRLEVWADRSGGDTPRLGEGGPC